MLYNSLWAWVYDIYKAQCMQDVQGHQSNLILLITPPPQHFPADRGMAMAIPRMDLEDIHHVWANGRKMFTHQPQYIYTLIHIVYSHNNKINNKKYYIHTYLTPTNQEPYILQK